ncbi:PAS domain S-box protein [Ferruginibacter sp.]
MISPGNKSTSKDKFSFLSGGGEMGALIREKDWSKTGVGNPETWPQSLRTTLSILLNSKFPMFLFWGTDLICFYNDAYRPSLGKEGKHPYILGERGEEHWTEIWHIIKPLIDQVLAGGEASWNEDQLIPIYRNNKIEDVYWTFSYSPVNDESGKPAGVFVTCNETTDKVETLQKLKENKDQLEFAIEAAELGTWDYNPATNKFTGNQRLKKWFGLQPEGEIELGQAINVIAEKDQQRIIAAIQKALDYSSGGNYEAEYRIVNPVTKKEIIVLARGKAWFNNEKVAYRFNGTMEDITAQVLSAKKITESEKKFRDLVMQSPVPKAILKGPDFIVEMANRALLQNIWRKEESEVTGKNILEVFPGLKNQKFPALLDKVYKTGKAHAESEAFISFTNNGVTENFYVDFEYAPLFEADDNISGIKITAIDVTEKVEARKKIEKSEKEFRQLADSLPELVWTTDKDGNQTFASKRWKEYTGLDPYDITSFEKMVHPEDLQNVVNAWTECLTAGNIYRTQLRLKSKNGDYEWFYVHGEAIKDANGNIEKWIGSFTNFNDQKIAEAELVNALYQIEKSEEQFRTLADNMSQFAWMADDKGWIYWYNKRWYEYTGTSLEEMQGWGWQKVHHPDYVERVVKKIQHSFDTGEYWEDTFPLKSKTGEYNWFLSRASAIRDAEGKILHWFGTNTNITTQKNIEENLAYRTALLEAYQHASFDGILLVDAKGKIINYNQRFVEAWNMPQHIVEEKDDVAALNYAMNQLVNPQQFIERVNYLYDHPAETSIDELEFKNGKIIERFGYPVKGLDGTFYAWAWIFRDITEKKNYENSVLESEQRFRNVANSAPVFIWMAGTDKLRYFFNTAWLEFTGRTLEQEKGNGWAAGIHPDDFKTYLNKYLTAFEKKVQFYSEYRLKRHDGDYRWVSAKGVPRFTSEGIFDGFTGACMDIHERVIYQKKLKEDEERLSIIINASELGTWELNVKTREVIYSDRYLEIFGYKNRVELNHHELIKHLHPDDFGIRERAFKKALSTGILHYEARLIWNDKSIHWMEGKGKVFYDENNQPDKLIGTMRDITEEKNYQQQLLGREQKFRLLADSMPEFVWTGDTEGNLNYFNQSVYDYTGLTAEEIDKDGWLQIVHPDDREENTRLWLNAISTGKDFLFEHRFKRYDGEYRWQLSRATPQKDSAGNIQMWVGTSTDIQEMKEMDAQKDLFISMASHELKTPVTSIKGYVQILQSMHTDSEDDFLKKSLGIIDKQIVNLTDLIADMLDLSKIKTGSLSLNKESFKINELVVEITEEIRHINPTATIIFSHEDEPVVFADRSRIGQVLINFLSNAVKYSPGTGTIKIKSMVEKDIAIISVEDSGIGINKTDQKKIFERFYRVEGKNEKTFPGFGIGLFIASEIIRNHGGDIGVVSEPGKGSIFSFSLPCTKNLNEKNVS